VTEARFAHAEHSRVLHAKSCPAIDRVRDEQGEVYLLTRTQAARWLDQDRTRRTCSICCPPDPRVLRIVSDTPADV
jgi:hypothetical protein